MTEEEGVAGSDRRSMAGWRKKTGIDSTMKRVATKKNMCDFLVKLILIGDSDVGKTSLMMRFSEDRFTASHIATIGIDFQVKTIIMADQLIKLQIWDTAGQERFLAITTAYYRSIDGVVLVYDITNEKSYNNIRNWIRRVRQNTDNSNVNFILVGNKCDLEEERKVQKEQGEGLAREYQMEFLEASGKQDINIQEVFAHLTRTIIRRTTKDPYFDSAYDAPHLLAERALQLTQEEVPGEEERQTCCGSS